MHACVRPHTAFVGLTHSKVDAFRGRTILAASSNPIAISDDRSYRVILVHGSGFKLEMMLNEGQMSTWFVIQFTAVKSVRALEEAL